MKARPDSLPALLWLVVAGVLLLIASTPLAPAAAHGTGIGGCPLFPADNIWNAPVDQLPVDPHSDAYIASLGATTGLHPDFGAGLWAGEPIGIPYNLVPGSQPGVTISHFTYDGESDHQLYPIPPNPLIEGGPNSHGDRHVLIVDQDHCRLYELFAAYLNGDGTWQAGSGAIFDLRSNLLRPDGWTSADAAGLPILPGLVRYEEVASGRILHALRFTADITAPGYVWPARHEAGSGGVNDPPLGQRFRLKASFDISSFSHQVQVILTAMQTYGIILADNGSSWFISGAPDDRWDNDQLVGELSRVKGADFEAIDESALMVSMDSGQVKTNPPPVQGPYILWLPLFARQ